MTSSEKEPLTLERYLRESCIGGRAKLRAINQQDTEGLYLRIEVKGLGRPAYAFRLRGDQIETAV